MAVIKDAVAQWRHPGRLVRRGWPAFLLAAMITGLVIFVTREPHYTTYDTAYGVQRMLLLILGVLYFIGSALVDAWLPLALVVFLLVGGVLWLVGWLWWERRTASLITVGVVLAANVLFIGAPGFVRIGSLEARIDECTYFLDARTALRVIRYPQHDNLIYGEQQFVLHTADGGESWAQLFQTYSNSPAITGCAMIDWDGDDEVVITFERESATGGTRLEHYRSGDRGLTWEPARVVEDD
ncbi:MAG: hypothetical protein ACOCX3_01985 [Chloroflexota bacterium]